MPASWASSSRTDRCRPARSACRRSRWAICRASTQVNTWTRMLCSLQWNIERHDVAVLELAEGELGLGLGPVAGYHLGDRPVVVVADQDVLAEQLVLQPGASIRVDGPGQAQLGGLVTGQVPPDDAPDPGVLGEGGDVLLDLDTGSAGAAASEGGGQVVQLAGGLGQGGALEPGDLGGVQLVGVGQDRPPAGAVDLAAGIDRGQPRIAGDWSASLGG